MTADSPAAPAPAPQPSPAPAQPVRPPQTETDKRGNTPPLKIR